MRAATLPDVSGVSIEHGIVMSLAILGKCLDHMRIGFVTVRLESIRHHAEAAIRHYGPLQGRVGLKTDDDFILSIDVARIMCRDGTWNLGNIEHPFLSLFHKEVIQPIP